MKGGRNDHFEVAPGSSVSRPSVNRQRNSRATSPPVTPPPSYLREHLPNVDVALTHRKAQLVIAREYGYAVEVGWFWGRLGRNRVLLLVRGDVEIPSDLDGIEYHAYKRSVLEAEAGIRRFLLEAI
jgi:hypothetical protein